MANCDLIAVDVGNSFVKVHAGPGVNRPWQTVAELRLETRSLAKADGAERRLREWLNDVGVPEAARWLVASVHVEAERWLSDWVRTARPADHYCRLVRDDIPLRTEVLHPHRVGIDRLLDAWAVNHLRQAHRPAVVIDAGSAVTVDAVRADGCFLGGAILPGLRMAASALSQATSQLPLVGPIADDWPDVIGRSTQEAIRSGVLWGTVGAVREITRRMDKQLGGGAQVFVTGGDADCLRPPAADEPVEFYPNLVLSGIRLLGQRLQTELLPP